MAGAKVILVLGHTNNQAVAMAVESMLEEGAAGPNSDCPNLHPIVRDIQESVDPSWRVDWAQISEEARRGRIDEVARRHVHRTLRRIREQSPVLAKLAHAGRIAVVGGMYDVRSGAVELL